MEKILLAAVFSFVCVGLLVGCQKKETAAMPDMPATNSAPATPAAPATNAPAAPAPAQ